MKLKNILITVNDIEKSKKFYHDLFGLEVILDNDGNNLEITISIILKDGYDIREVCEQVQEKVKEAIESMLDLKVKNVTVRVAQINMV